MVAQIDVNNNPTASPPFGRVEWLAVAGLGALLFFVPLAFTYLTDVGLFKWVAVTTAAPLVATLVIVQAGWTGRLFTRHSPIVFAAIAYPLTAAASLLFADTGAFGMPALLRQAALCAALLTAYHLAREPRARIAFLWCAVACGLCVAIYGIFQHFGYDFFPWAENAEVPVERGVSFFGHSTFAASYLILAIPLAIGLAVTQSSPAARMAAGACLLPMLYHLSFTGARGAALAITASALATVIAGVFAFRTGRVTQKMLAACGTLIVIAALGGAFLLVSAWREKDSDLSGLRQAAGAVRLITWETAARVFAAHPVVGAGAGHYELVSPAYWNVAEADRFARLNRMSAQVHNDYLETAAEQGILGVAVLLALVLGGIAAAFAIARRGASWNERALGLAIFAALVAGACDAFLIYSFQAAGSALLYWVLLGIAAAGAQRSPAP